MAYGITAAGFVRKRLADIKTDQETKFKSVFGEGINLLPGSNFSQIIGIQCDELSQLWELAEASYNAQNKDTAEGANLDNVLAIVRVQRNSKRKTLQQSLLLFGVAGSVIPALTKVGVVGNAEAIFETQSSVTLVAGQNQIQRISFDHVGTSGSYVLRFIDQDTAPIAYNANAAAVLAALNLIPRINGAVTAVTGDYNVLKYFDITFGGTLGKIDLPHIQVPTNTVLWASGSVVIAWLSNTQSGIPQGVVDAQATEYGAISAPLFTMTTIINPVTGLTSVLNIDDAVTGRDDEDDPNYRLRSATDQASSGRGTLDAIRSKLKELLGVNQVAMFENTTDSVDANSLPAHSFRAYVDGGADQDIWDTIWQNKPSGIQADGTQVGTTVDSQGVTQPVKFSRPVEVPIFISVTLTKDTDFPSDGAVQARTVLSDFINSLDIGQDVIVYPRLLSTLNAIAGIEDIVLHVGTSASPTLDDNIAIGINQVAKVVDAVADVLVTVV